MGTSPGACDGRGVNRRDSATLWPDSLSQDSQQILPVNTLEASGFVYIYCGPCGCTQRSVTLRGEHTWSLGAEGTRGGVTWSLGAEAVGGGATPGKGGPLGATDEPGAAFTFTQYRQGLTPNTHTHTHTHTHTLGISMHMYTQNTHQPQISC